MSVFGHTMNGNFKVFDLFMDLEKLKEFLSLGGDPNLKVDDQGALLHHASNLEIVKELLAHGASVNLTNSFQETTLDRAIANHSKHFIVKELLKNGAYVNAQNRKGNTPLNMAIKNSSTLEVIQELLKYGADINIRNRERRWLDDHYSPLDHAVKDPKYAKLLIKFTLMKVFDKDYAKLIDLTPYKELSTYDEINSYLSDCVCEVLQMKTYTVKGNFSLYELVKKEVDKNSPFDHQLVRFSAGLTNIDVPSLFPIYHDIIFDKLKPYMERLALIDQLINKKIYAWKDEPKPFKVILNYDCADKIAECLNNNDLSNFIAAFDSKISKNDNTLSAPNVESDEPCTNSPAKRQRME